MAEDPFKMLGLPADAGRDEIKAAFRRLAKKYHPDVTGDSGDKFRRILLAYEHLSGGGGIAPSGDREFDYYLRVHIDREKNKVQDLYDDLRDGFLTFFNVDLPEYLTLYLELNPAEAARGGRVKLDLPLVRKCRSCYGFGQIILRKCRNCGGSGEVEYRKSTVLQIPGGVKGGESTRLRLDNLHLTVVLRIKGERTF